MKLGPNRPKEAEVKAGNTNPSPPDAGYTDESQVTSAAVLTEEAPDMYQSLSLGRYRAPRV
jgi:hypothetical protein